MKTYYDLRNEQKVLELFVSTIKENVFPLIPNYTDEGTYKQLKEYHRYFTAFLSGLWYGAGSSPMWDFFKFNLSDVEKHPLEIAYLIGVQRHRHTALKQVLINPKDDLDKAINVYDKYPSIQKNIIIYYPELDSMVYDKDLFYQSYCEDIVN